MLLWFNLLSIIKLDFIFKISWSEKNESNNVVYVVLLKDEFCLHVFDSGSPENLIVRVFKFPCRHRCFQLCHGHEQILVELITGKINELTTRHEGFIRFLQKQVNSGSDVSSYWLWGEAVERTHICWGVTCSLTWGLHRVEECRNFRAWF